MTPFEAFRMLEEAKNEFTSNPPHAVGESWLWLKCDSDGNPY